MTNDDVYTHSSVLLPLSLTELGNAMAPGNQALCFSALAIEKRVNLLQYETLGWKYFLTFTSLQKRQVS